MFKKSILTNSLLLALVAPSVVMAEVEATIELRNETAVYTRSGQTIGQETTRTDTNKKQNGGDLIKFQNQAKIFLNGDIGEESSWHAEIQIIYDSEAINSEDTGGINYKGHESYTQNDYFRELYVDTEIGDWALRLGKQQVVWGTADGIKLLDIINPTDFREVNQNVMEDARIPVWMINAERSVGENGNFQFVVSQAETNKIPGLNPSGDQGHPYVMKGTDTISGKVNGFFNIGTAMGQVARFFAQAAGGGANLTGFTGATVQEFVDDGNDANAFGGACQAEGIGAGALTNGECLYQLANETDGLGGGAPIKGSNNDVTNLIQPTTTEFNTGSADTVFELMRNATFATFHSFSGMSTVWRKDYNEFEDVNGGFRFKQNTDSGINYSLNYFYHAEANPYFDLSWEDQNGNPLDVVYVQNAAGVGGNTQGAATTTVSLRSGGAAILPTNLGGTQDARLIFTEKLNHIHSLGGSFDMAIDSMEVPLVLRGEFLYDKDTKVPVVDMASMQIGDVQNALKSEDADFIKYVIGLDATVMTNLLVSGQFIQYINLDYIDQTGWAPTRNGVTSNVTGARYTADPATMHISNGLQKGWETKEWVSIFLSKPIGEDQLGRWNNITIWEEGGGFWNRLDAEYSVSDQFIVSGEWNHYWGDENTTFGQLENSSNVQVGFKYIFEDY